LSTRQRTPVSCALGALALTVALAAGGCAGSTSTQSTPAALKLQREDLAAVARELMRAQAPVAQEAATTKRAWPKLTAGVGQESAAASSAPVERALEAATLQVPALFGELQARSLTGPAAGVAGLFRYSALLSTRGWTMLIASFKQITSGTPAARRFASENVGLYTESIYDGHFGLAQIGKKLLAGYEKLGGPSAFAATLTQADVDTLARSYSEGSLRLHPHPPVRVGS
jgi:hypothetical protein